MIPSVGRCQKSGNKLAGVREMLATDHWATVKLFQDQLFSNQHTVCQILHDIHNEEDLHEGCSICAWVVPHSFVDEQKERSHNYIHVTLCIVTFVKQKYQHNFMSGYCICWYMYSAVYYYCLVPLKMAWWQTEMCWRHSAVMCNMCTLMVNE
jgi:hypothetical protein